MVEANKLLRELKKKAKEDGIPIMSDKGIDYLTTFILKNKINTVLEIGTAVGFSAISMALVNPKLKVVTIERDEERYMEAVKNVKKFDLEDRITCIFNDALNVKLDDKFDLIFIDAAKGQNINFFERFSTNLEDKGFIITDNMKFHGYVDMPEEEIKNRNLRGLVRKIKEYKTYLEENDKYETEFSDIGDGLAISTPRID
ncbi:MAG: O-methyltransferase [Bacilli bacterium]|nr:O-methyltransferase [Bacilli bacterium]